MGATSFSMSLIPDDTEIDKWSKLTGVKHGQLHYTLYFTPELSDDTYEIIAVHLFYSFVNFFQANHNRCLTKFNRLKEAFNDRPTFPWHLFNSAVAPVMFTRDSKYERVKSQTSVFGLTVDAFGEIKPTGTPPDLEARDSIP